MKILCSTLALVALCGCGEQSAAWKEIDADVDGAVEVQIAVRSHAYQQGDGVNEGDFLILSSNVFPIPSAAGPGHVVCNRDGVIIELQWDVVRLLQDRIAGQQGAQTFLAFDNFRYAIENEVVSGGTSYRFGSGDDVQILSTEFRPLVSPLELQSGVEGNDRALVIRARWLPQAVPAEPLTIPPMQSEVDSAG